MLVLSHGSALLAASSTATGSNSNWSVFLAVGVVVCWVVSLRLHPYTACSACNGKARLFGAVARRSFRLCPTCGGNGRRKRNFANIWAKNRLLK